jgi:hypothetical protein
MMRTKNLERNKKKFKKTMKEIKTIKSMKDPTRLKEMKIRIIQTARIMFRKNILASLILRSTKFFGSVIKLKKMKPLHSNI